MLLFVPTPQHLVADTTLSSRHSVVKPQGKTIRLNMTFQIIHSSSYTKSSTLSPSKTLLHLRQPRTNAGWTVATKCRGPLCFTKCSTPASVPLPEPQKSNAGHSDLYIVSTSKRCIVQNFSNPMPSPTPGIRYPYSSKPHSRRDQQVLRDCTSGHPANPFYDSTHAK